MANNSGNTNTANQLAFGQFGSTFLTGTGGVDLSGSSATRYVSAITVITATKFTALENMDGANGFMSTVDGENALNAASGIGAAGDGTDLADTVAFPVGITLYGKWDKVTLAEGSVVCYFAPRTVNNV